MIKTSYLDIAECIRVAQVELIQAENKLNYVTGADVEVAIAEYNAKLAKLNRLFQIAKEERKVGIA